MTAAELPVFFTNGVSVFAGAFGEVTTFMSCSSGGGDDCEKEVTHVISAKTTTPKPNLTFLKSSPIFCITDWYSKRGAIADLNEMLLAKIPQSRAISKFFTVKALATSHNVETINRPTFVKILMPIHKKYLYMQCQNFIHQLASDVKRYFLNSLVRYCSTETLAISSKLRFGRTRSPAFSMKLRSSMSFIGAANR